MSIKAKQGVRARSIVEVMITLVLAALIIGGGFNLLSSAYRGEIRTFHKADATEQAGLAYTAVSRDLANLHFDYDTAKVQVEESSRLAFQVYPRDLASVPLEVEYRFDARTGVLTRTTTGQPAHTYPLGKDASVRFKVERPVFVNGRVPIGQYNNRVTYQITTRSGGAHDAQVFSLIGAAPLTRKASQDTFPVWNPFTPAKAP